MRPPSRSRKNILSFLAICCIAGAVPVSNDGKNSVIVNDQYQFEWSVSGEDIYFTVTAQTTGFVALGVLPETGMEDEDVCIVGIYPDGTVYINDYHAHEPSIPHLDVEEGGTEDWLLVDVSETETATTATFYRKLVTADPLNDQPILPGVARLVWSYGEADPTDFDNIILQRETTGVVEVVLVEP
ncbi:DBH-like monooxygenase protein 2 isoform X2 [Artemia franciscana]|uniref:DBH-like monooxygenase protein 2 isoform X2 n=1 Tax=Artemia franciscana TaxID=6661 RepID=UPI0032D9D3DA